MGDIEATKRNNDTKTNTNTCMDRLTSTDMHDDICKDILTSSVIDKGGQTMSSKHCGNIEQNGVIETIGGIHEVCSLFIQQHEQTSPFIETLKKIKHMSGKDGQLIEELSKSQKVTALEEQLNVLRKKLEESNNENKSLKSDLEATKSNHEKKCAKFSSNIRQLKKEQRETQRLKENLEKSNNALKREIAVLESPEGMKDRMTKLYQKRIADLMKEVADIKQAQTAAPPAASGRNAKKSKKKRDKSPSPQEKEQILQSQELIDKGGLDYAPKTKGLDYGPKTKDTSTLSDWNPDTEPILLNNQQEDPKETNENKSKELNKIKLEYQEEIASYKKIMKEKSAKELEQTKQKYINKLEICKLENQQLEKSEKSMKERVESQTKELERGQREYKELKKQNEKIVKEKEKLTDSLSQIMNQRFNTDESDVENVNIMNRPLKLAEEYDLFCSDVWLHAKAALDNFAEKAAYFPLPENKKNHILVDIIMDTFNLCEITVTKQQQRIEMCLKTPFRQNENRRRTYIEVIDSCEPHNPKQGLPEELNLAITKYLKINADDIDCDNVVQHILSKHMKTIPEGELDKEALHSNDLKNFVEATCKLSWKMCIQKPPMLFSVDDIGKPFDDTKHELVFGSKDPTQSGVCIAYYVYPSLFHGKQLLRKGKVMLQ